MQKQEFEKLTCVKVTDDTYKQIEDIYITDNQLKYIIMNKYSKCAKLNKVLCEIDDYIRSNYNNEMDMICELTRYKTEFLHEPDYNYAQYGCCLIYYYDVRQLYKDCGYKSIDKYQDEKIWNIYKRHVGYVINKILQEYSTKIGYFKRIKNITNNN